MYGITFTAGYVFINFPDDLTRNQPDTFTHRPIAASYHCVNGWIKAESCIFGGEGLSGRCHQVWVSCAGPALCDVLQRRLAAQRCVVWLAGRQEMRRLVSCHHLTSIGKDGGGEEAEGVDTWERERGRVSVCIRELEEESMKVVRVGDKRSDMEGNGCTLTAACVGEKGQTDTAFAFVLLKFDPSL